MWVAGGVLVGPGCPGASTLGLRYGKDRSPSSVDLGEVAYESTWPRPGDFWQGCSKADADTERLPYGCASSVEWFVCRYRWITTPENAIIAYANHYCFNGRAIGY
jgi:hypothetical protein